MADIQIRSQDGSQSYGLYSVHRTTVREAKDGEGRLWGSGELKDANGALLLSGSLVLTPGAYVWVRAREDATGGPDAERYHQLERRLQRTEREIVDMKVKDSRAVSYSDYYNEKRIEGRISNWHPEIRGNYFPTVLQNPDTGRESKEVKPFWETALENPLVTDIPTVTKLAISERRFLILPSTPPK